MAVCCTSESRVSGTGDMVVVNTILDNIMEISQLFTPISLRLYFSYK